VPIESAIVWDAVREAEFPIARNWAYFDHAAVSPLPRRSADALRAWTESQERDGVVRWPEWEGRVEKTRDEAARLLNADRDEIALVANTTQGISLVAEGFPWNEGDNVVTAADEFASNIYPWMNLESRGVALRQVESRSGRIYLEDLAAAIDHRTRMLAISHVEFATGFRNDLDALAEMCHQRGIALFVDAIQGLGPLVIDVRLTPIDFLAADGHKWLLGPESAGLLYIRRDWIDRLRPIGVGWHSVVGSYNSLRNEFRLKPGAQRWEGGSFNMPGLQGFGASLGLFHELGPTMISDRVMDRADAAREAARSAGWSVFGSTRAAECSAIVVVEKDSVDPHAVVRELRHEGIVVSCRRGRLRISPHFYNNDDDFRRLRSGLARMH
jgi:selenocysteine lyase/cysteine desulfurase